MPNPVSPFPLVHRFAAAGRSLGVAARLAVSGVALLLAPAAPAAEPSAPPPIQPPEVQEHFPAEGTPAHTFLVIDVRTGDALRVDDAQAVGREPVPLGTGYRFLAALAALEEGSVDPDATVACDSTCWAQGAHGDVALVNALAWGCDTYFAHLDVDRAAVDRAAAGVGLAAAGPTLRAWTRFWRRSERSELHLRSETLSQLLAAAALSVSSPRGLARSLYDSRHGARAIVGSSEAGSWVAGVATVAGGRRWAFALFLPGGNTNLAVTRCAHLLEETRRTYRRSTSVRGGDPWREIED